MKQYLPPLPAPAPPAPPGGWACARLEWAALPGGWYWTWAAPWAQQLQGIPGWAGGGRRWTHWRWSGPWCGGPQSGWWTPSSRRLWLKSHFFLLLKTSVRRQSCNNQYEAPDTPGWLGFTLMMELALIWWNIRLELLELLELLEPLPAAWELELDDGKSLVVIRS